MRTEAWAGLLLLAVALAGCIGTTDETNDQGYTHLRVTGQGQVLILERGYGSDPWDAGKDVFEVTP